MARSDGVTARFWQCLVLGHLSLAATLAGLLAILERLPGREAVLIAFAAFLAFPALFLVISFSISLACTRGDTSPLISRIALALRALLIESVQLPRAIAAMIVAPRSAASQTLGAGAALRPVMLIHGILSNHAIWKPWFGRLQAAGFAPVHAIDLEPFLGDLDSHAASVIEELRALQRRCRGARIAIIAHSRGGLVARGALDALGPAVISQVITIGSPHHGSAIARLFPGAAAHEVRPDSPWLCAMRAREALGPSVPFTSIYSMQDNLVVPARTALLHGARVIELKGLGHLSLMGCRSSIERAIGALS